MKQIDYIRKNKGLVKAAVYARFSSDRQREESIEAQMRAIKEHANREGLTIVKTYIDRAKTATTDRRPGFLQMIHDSKEKMFDVVIVHKLDRFARSRADSIGYKMELKRAGVSLLSITEPIDDSPESIILESVLEAMAEYYSKNLGREVMKGLRENALKGLHTGGAAPLGYRVNPHTKRLEIDEYEAQAVKLIFSMFLDGYGYNSIFKELNARGYKTKRGKPFAKNSLYSILRNEKYTGTLLYNLRASKDADGRYNTHKHKDDDEVIRIEDGAPAIISKEDYHRVGKKLNDRKRLGLNASSRKHNFLLTGKIYCGECGNRMNGQSRMNGKKVNKCQYISYRCSLKNNRDLCTNGEIKRDSVEGFVLTQLADYLFDDRLIPQIAEEYQQLQAEMTKFQSNEATELKKRLIDVDRKLDNLMEALAEYGNSKSFADKVSKLEEEKSMLESRLLELEGILCALKNPKENAEDIKKHFHSARELFKIGKLETTKALLDLFVESVIVYRDRVHVLLRFAPDVPPQDDLHERLKAPEYKEIPTPLTGCGIAGGANHKGKKIIP